MAEAKTEPLLPDPPPPAAEEAAAASAAADEKPKRSHKKTTAEGGTGNGRAKRPVGRPPKPKLGERCGAMIAGVGVGVAAFNRADGWAIIGGAEELGNALEKWAEENPSVRRVLEGLLEASAGGMVLVAAAKIALPIAANHGVLPAHFAAGIGDALGTHPAPPADPAQSNGHAAAA